MCFLRIIVIGCLLLAVKAKVSNDEDAKRYLKQYGYIGNNCLVDYDTALMESQERYNLFVDGKLNEETVTLMNRARCIVGENYFRVASKWNKTHLVWYIPQVNEEYRKLAKKAFEIWEEKPI